MFPIVDINLAQVRPVVLMPDRSEPSFSVQSSMAVMLSQRVVGPRRFSRSGATSLRSPSCSCTRVGSPLEQQLYL